MSKYIILVGILISSHALAYSQSLGENPALIKSKNGSVILHVPANTYVSLSRGTNTLVVDSLVLGSNSVLDLGDASKKGSTFVLKSRISRIDKGSRIISWGTGLGGDTPTPENGTHGSPARNLKIDLGEITFQVNPQKNNLEPLRMYGRCLEKKNDYCARRSMNVLSDLFLKSTLKFDRSQAKNKLLTIEAIGGNGSNGGQGKTGRRGRTAECLGSSGGPGGRGKRGYNGGNAGSGGNINLSGILSKESISINIATDFAFKTKAGTPGKRGQGGLGGPGGHGKSCLGYRRGGGRSGTEGSPGSRGIDGSNGSYTVNILPYRPSLVPSNTNKKIAIKHFCKVNGEEKPPIIANSDSDELCKNFRLSKYLCTDRYGPNARAYKISCTEIE